MRVDSTPYAAPHLPFANEDDMQGFLEEHAEQLFGLKVIASASRDGELFEIDVLAVNAANTPFIIEGKWDLVGSGAIRQLEGYRKRLLDNRPSFLKRVSETRSRQVVVQPREPVLVAIGYRYEPSVLREAKAQSVFCLTYAYHNVTRRACPHMSPPFHAVEPRPRGEVSIQLANETLMPPSRHPTVCKRHITIERLKQLPGELQTAFWEVDAKLRELNTVTAVYGKNPDACYRVPRGKFAEARLCRKKSGWIRWRYCQSGVWKNKEMLAACDAKKIFHRLRQAHVDAGQALCGGLDTRVSLNETMSRDTLSLGSLKFRVRLAKSLILDVS